MFCFLLQNELERMFQEVVVSALKDGVKESFQTLEIFDLIYEKLTFLGKIQIVESLFKNKPDLEKKFKDFISFCKDYNQNIRNNLFHAKLDQVKYKDEKISNPLTQQRLLNDMILTTRKFGE